MPFLHYGFSRVHVFGDDGVANHLAGDLTGRKAPRNHTLHVAATSVHGARNSTLKMFPVRVRRVWDPAHHKADRATTIDQIKLPINLQKPA